MDYAFYYILPTERNEFKKLVSEARIILKKQSNIAVSKKKSQKIPLEDLTFQLENLNIKFGSNDKSTENTGYSKKSLHEKLNDKYNLCVKKFDQIIQQSYKELTEWFVKELADRRDAYAGGWVSINRSYSFFQNEPVNMEIVYSIPNSFEFNLGIENNYIGHIFKKSYASGVYDSVKKSNSNLIRLVFDFGVNKILFEHCDVERAYDYFKDTINSQFGEKVISIDDMKNIYLEQGLLEKSYLKSHKLFSKVLAQFH